MSVTVAEIIAALEAVAPTALAEPWDHVGLQIGDPSAAVTAVMLAVDATAEVASQAAAAGAGLLLTHHPLLFSPLSSIIAGDPVADAARILLRAGLSLYCAHTNLDVVPEQGTAAALAAVVGLVDPQPLACGCAGGAGAGRVGLLPQSLKACELAAHVRRQLSAPWVALHGDPQGSITRVVAIPGAGGEGLAEAAGAGAQAVVTGELKHHELLEARARGLCVILAGHLYTERPVLPLLQDYLTRTLPGLKVTLAAETAPCGVITD